MRKILRFKNRTI